MNLDYERIKKAIEFINSNVEEQPLLKLLKKQKPVLDVSLSLGFIISSGSRLHEHFVKLEAVTTGEYKTKGIGLHIDYATMIHTLEKYL